MESDRKDGIRSRTDRPTHPSAHSSCCSIRRPCNNSLPTRGTTTHQIKLEPLSLFFPLIIATMVIKNDNNQDSIVTQQGNVNRPWSIASGLNLGIVKQCSAEDPISILESSTGERVYTFGPVFESEERNTVGLRKSLRNSMARRVSLIVSQWCGKQRRWSKSTAPGALTTLDPSGVGGGRLLALLLSYTV